MRRFGSASCALAIALGLGLSACSSSDKTADTTPEQNPTTSEVAGTSVPKGYDASREVPPAALDAIRQYEIKNGPPLGTWVITSALVSAVDPAYVLFRISPAEGHETEVQGGYGFVRNQNDKWTVLGFGTEAVGCPPGTAENPPVPPTVLDAFSLTCAPVS